MNSIDIDLEISKLIQYGLDKQLIEIEDKYYTINKILDILNLDDFKEKEITSKGIVLEEVLKNILTWAIENNLIEDSIVYKDLFDTKIMGTLTSAPSVINKQFYNLYKNEGAENATSWFYKYCKDVDYIREYRVKKDLGWKTKSIYGDIDITINLSKPEKDPKAIAAMKNAIQSAYPKCQLCKENVGYRGRINHPARENLRIIPLNLDGDNFNFQYSPYSYYNEHCIVFNNEHIPMAINDKCFKHLVDFVKQFPHYMLGSNADLPIVGGSILTHDHYQGGNYIFPMFLAKETRKLNFEGFLDVECSTIFWPLSVIRIKSSNEQSLIKLANKILDSWRVYSDDTNGIYAYTDDVPHNTITPICHKENDKYVLDLTLRNNITTEEYPLGVFHPHSEYWNIKKENIGLIEVMGRAILPSRLKNELNEIKECLLKNGDIKNNENIAKHSDWVNSFISNYKITADNIDEILKTEVGNTFVKVLECCGVFKQDKQGQEGLDNFVKFVNKR